MVMLKLVFDSIWETGAPLELAWGPPPVRARLLHTQERHSKGRGVLTQLAAKRGEIFAVIPQALFQE